MNPCQIHPKPVPELLQKHSGSFSGPVWNPCETRSNTLPEPFHKPSQTLTKQWKNCLQFLPQPFRKFSKIIPETSGIGTIRPPPAACRRCLQLPSNASNERRTIKRRPPSNARRNDELLCMCVCVLVYVGSRWWSQDVVDIARRDWLYDHC